MEHSTRRIEFAPPPAPGMLRALILAILAHALLLVALTLGVQWKREAVQQPVEAELWSSIPVQAAPPAPVPEPEPPKPAPPEVKPEPKPDPGPTPAEIKAQADIALAKEKEKAKQLKEKQLALEKAELEKKKQAELEKQAKLEQEKKDKEKQDKLKKEQADKLAAEKDKAQRKQDQQAEAAAAKAREDQIKRLERLAGADGGGSTRGGTSAAQSSGPSPSYAGRIVAKIKPNITYPENISGNPRVEVEIRTSPTGNILSARITQSSGVKSWDDAVTRAILKTEVLPKDVDGSIPNTMLIGFRPKD